MTICRYTHLSINIGTLGLEIGGHTAKHLNNAGSRRVPVYGVETKRDGEGPLACGLPRENVYIANDYSVGELVEALNRDRRTQPLARKLESISPDIRTGQGAAAFPPLATAIAQIERREIKGFLELFCFSWNWTPTTF